MPSAPLPLPEGAGGEGEGEGDEDDEKSRPRSAAPPLPLSVLLLFTLLLLVLLCPPLVEVVAVGPAPLTAVGDGELHRRSDRLSRLPMLGLMLLLLLGAAAVVAAVFVVLALLAFGGRGTLRVGTLYGVWKSGLSRVRDCEVDVVALGDELAADVFAPCPPRLA